MLIFISSVNACSPAGAAWRRKLSKGNFIKNRGDLFFGRFTSGVDIRHTLGSCHVAIEGLRSLGLGVVVGAVAVVAEA